MKFRWKIFCLCIGVYFITLAAAGTIVLRSTYNNLMEKEITRCLKEEKNIVLTLNLLMRSSMTSSIEADISEYSSYAVDILGTEGSYVEIYDSGFKLLATNLNLEIGQERGELNTAMDKGRNYILRRMKGRHYIFITDPVTYGNSKAFYLVVVRDISAVDDQVRALLKYFIEAAAAGLVIAAIFAGIIGKIIMKPVDELIHVSKEIASGKYNERVKVSSRDEIGILSDQFNSMAQEVERRISELEDEAERKQRFIDNLAHEIRTPLTSIIGYADLIMNVKYDRSLLFKSLSYIKTEGMRILKMANSLMDIILLRENDLEMIKYDTSKLKEEICSIMSFKSEQRGVELKTLGEDYELFTDINLLKEVLLNLVDNGINACSAGGSVIIGTSFINNSRCIYVKDNGRGMEKNEIEKIFEPFYRVDRSRARKDGGAGLGLSICSEIVARLKGRIVVESSLSEGTNISIFL